MNQKYENTYIQLRTFISQAKRVYAYVKLTPEEIEGVYVKLNKKDLITNLDVLYLKDKDDWQSRWEDIKTNKKIIVKDYENTSGPILLVCNRGKEGYGGGGKPAHEWAKETIEELMKYTKRSFIVRFHSANSYDKSGNVKEFLKYSFDNVEIQNPDRNYPNLLETIRRSYAVVTFASSAAAPAIIEGRHLFVTSPTCFFYEDRSGELSDIENPKQINRDNFFKRYSHSHWNLLDLRSGDFWRHVKDEI